MDYFDALKIPRDLLNTANRTMTSSFVPSQYSSNMDPVAHIMNKEHSSVKRVNTKDVSAMAVKMGWSLAQAYSYIEACCQVPEHVNSTSATFFTNAYHASATDPLNSSVNTENTLWFVNAWGIADNGIRPEVTSWKKWASVAQKPAVLWTKDKVTVDPFSAAYDKYVPRMAVIWQSR
uniref:Uncharacterized protein n=1 Tax=viral metagenome TaxID=1070528 RepID=A0A2V0RCE9_9ZZZZ